MYDHCLSADIIGSHTEMCCILKYRGVLKFIDVMKYGINSVLVLKHTGTGTGTSGCLGAKTSLEVGSNKLCIYLTAETQCREDLMTVTVP